MDNNQDWLELYQQRDQWAITAYEKFINQIDDALKADLTRSDQITIVVYGSTQVGKTSLILKILGIDDVHMVEVSTLLRGGREIGKSATIMPIRYRRSENDQWHIHDIKGKDTAVSTVEEYFKNLRENIEKGQTNSTNIIDVYIPQYYFSQRSEGVLDIRILDLPGTQALNKNEQYHVQEISEKYAANADLILLVGRSDDLAFINPSRLMLDQFKYWTSQPSRFRVILTRAFSPATVIDYVQQTQNTFNLETFKDRIFQQLSTHDFQIPQECREIIFPLEFGDSLENIQEKHADYFELIDRVNQNSFKLLHEGICKAANPYSRFKNGFDVQRLAKVRIEEEKQRFNEESKDIEQKQTLLLDSLSKFNNELQSIAENLFKLRSQSQYFLNLKDIFITENIIENWYGDFVQNMKVPSEKSVSELKKICEVYASGLKSLWRGLENFFFSELEEINFSFGLPPSLDTKNLKACNDELNNYLTDQYWFDRKFEEDYKMLRTAFQIEIERFIFESSQRLMAYLDQEIMLIKQKCHVLEIKQQQLNYGLEQKNKEISHFQMQKSDLQIKHQDFIDRMETAKQHGEAFEGLMKRSFEEVCQKAKTDFFDEQDAMKKFYRLWYSMLLETQYDEMMLGVKG